VKICPYCDFNRYVSESVDHERMRRAYLAELGRFLDLRLAAFGSKPTITSVFLWNLL